MVFRSKLRFTLGNPHDCQPLAPKIFRLILTNTWELGTFMRPRGLVKIRGDGRRFRCMRLPNPGSLSPPTIGVSSLPQSSSLCTSSPCGGGHQGWKVHPSVHGVHVAIHMVHIVPAGLILPR